MKKYFSIISIVVLFFVIGGCANTPEDPIENYKYEIDTNLKVGNNDSIIINISDTFKYSFGSDLTVCKLYNDTITIIQKFTEFIENPKNHEIQDYQIIFKMCNGKALVDAYSYSDFSTGHFRSDTILHKLSNPNITLNKSKYKINDTLIIKMDHITSPVDTSIKSYIKLSGITKMRVRDSTINFGILSYEKNVQNNYKK